MKVKASNLLIISLASLSAYAEQDEYYWGLDLQTLMTIKIGPSADASYRGLSETYPGGEIANGGRIGILGVQDNSDTPFSVTSYTRDFIRDHQATSVGDILQYDHSVRVARGFGNFQQVYMVRGLPAFSDDMTYNGLYGILPRQYMSAELIERVEILRGVNTFINGAAPGIGSCLGGAVDVIPKRAPKEDLAQVSLGSQSSGQHYLATDLATRSRDGSWGIRVNAVSSGGDTDVTAITQETRQLDMLTAGIDYRGSALRVSGDLGYQNHQLQAPQPSITFADNLPIPTAPSADKNIAQPWTHSNERDLFGTLRAEYDFTRSTTAWMAAGMRDGRESSISGAFLTVSDTDGNFSASRFDVAHKDAVFTGELGLTTHLDTSLGQHTLTLAASSYSNDSRNAYQIYNSFTNNLHHPSKTALPNTLVFGGGDLHHPLTTIKTRVHSLAIADEFNLLDEKLNITLGLRAQTIKEYDYDYNSGAETSAYDRKGLAPLLAGVYKISQQYSAYANYTEGLSKGDIAPPANAQGQVVNAGHALKPYQTRQIEAGVKYEGESFGGSAGVFTLSKPLSGYNQNNALVEQDEQRHRGFELLVYGQPTPRTKLLGGLSLLDTNAREKYAIGAPKTQANLGLEWNPVDLPKLSLRSDLIYTGTQFANVANTQRAPSWTRVDVGMSYKTQLYGDHPLTLRMNIENIFNQDYWASVGGFPGASYLTIGSPRSLLVNVSVNF